MPTRAGRHGLAYTRSRPDQPAQRPPRRRTRGRSTPPRHVPANTYSRAYLHHLVRSNEILGMMLLTWNNLAYYQDLMAGLRKAIAEGTLAEFIAAAKDGWTKAARDDAAEEAG